MAKKRKKAKKKSLKKKTSARRSGGRSRSRFAYSLGGPLDGDIDAQQSTAPQRQGLDADMQGTGELRLPTRTGRMMVVSMAKKATRSSIKSMLAQVAQSTGMGKTSAKICSSADFKTSAIAERDASSAEVVVFEEFGIAFLNNDPDQGRALQSTMAATAMTTASRGSSSYVVEEERVNYTLGFQSQMQSGFVQNEGASNQDLINALAQAMQSLNLAGATQATAQRFADTAESSWGLKACNVIGSRFSGRGIKVAIIDSGLDLSHPDFAGRNIETFVHVATELELQDGSTIPQVDNTIADPVGHGTHCTGTACGPLVSQFGPRYGVAHGANIFAAKVMFHHPFAATGIGFDMHIMDGIRAAMRAGCQVISMSLGSTREPGDPPFSQAYETIARTALQNGQLIIAATGNESERRFGSIQEVGGPANCPSVAAVAAINRSLGIADFSNGRAGNFNVGAEVNLSAPGVQILSSLPLQPSSFLVPRRRVATVTAKWDGTSMATPHVSGLAALIAEETGARGVQLYRELRNRARNIGRFSDFGHGLAQG